MNTIARISFFLLFVLVVADVSAQTQQQLSNFYDQFREVKNREWNDNSDLYDGSPYLFNEYKPGSIVLKGNSKSTEIPIRYNVYDDQVEYKEKGKTLALMKDTALVESFLIDGKRFILTPIAHKKENMSFVEVLVEGKFSLYRKYIVDFQPAVEAKGYQDPSPPTFKMESPIYFLKSEGSFEKVKGMKDMAKKLTDYSDELNKYIKSNKLKMKRDEDLVEFMGYLNSL